MVGLAEVPHGKVPSDSTVIMSHTPNYLTPAIAVFAAVATFFFVVWLLQLALPGSWPKAKRWIVALVVAPSTLGLLVLLVSGPGFLQQQLARVLLP